jgi:glycosyltransferase involved in cell wall biosynthesis
VGRDACEVCCRGKRPTRNTINPVIASFLFRVSKTVIDVGGVPDCTVDEAISLKVRALSNLPVGRGSKRAQTATRVCLSPPDRYLGGDRTYSCDVVLCCNDSSQRTERALRSVLDQKSAVTHLHLVDNGGGGRQIAERYQHVGNVTVHTQPVAKSPLATVHDLIDRMHTDFIAIQDPRTVSRPYRICYSVGLLREYGGDLLGGGVHTPRGTAMPRTPAARYARYLPPETLVVRRASFIDLGGVAERPGDDDAEFVYRAFRQACSILIAEQPTVDSARRLSHPRLGPRPQYQPRHGLLDHHARGFPQQRVACDAVLPFWGQVEFVRLAIEGLLSQENAEVVIHLVDDGTPENTDRFLHEWSSHPQLRTYRNLKNIGQFTTFNNLLPYLETDLIAVQDGDDISLPDRIHRAGNALRLSGADIFGSSVVIFDGKEPIRHDGWAQMPKDIRVQKRKNLGMSAWPVPSVFWFLFNPSMVLRKDVFRVLGGFSDFGNAVRNRCGHDIELCLRAYHSGMRFAISRQPTVLYRQHPDQTTRNAMTGFGTEAERWTSQETRRRGELFRRSRFDPSAFGALGKYQNLTVRFPDP